MATFPDSFIEQVRYTTDLVELVGQYLPLKRAGKNFKGLCPFHSEKTASFNVSPERQIFHCFGCGQGGDAFKFLMLYEKMSFVEAVSHLAQRAGMSLPARPRSAGRESEERTMLVELQEQAVRFFRDQLRESTAGQRAFAYLRERGLSEATIQETGFGYAPESWGALLEHLTRRGAKPEVVARAGLAVPRSEGQGYYDRFRDRVMIPIRNESGKIVAFGGRAVGEGQPKYLNSPETPIYVKSRILYGFDRAKESIRGNGFAILMEGYLDCIQAYQAGIANAVACCGTSLTAGHAQLLRRYTQKVVVNFDPDTAGAAATGRGIDLLVEEGFEVSVLELPAGEDPDRFIRSHGAEEYRARLSRPVSFVDYLIKKAAAQHDVDTPRGKVDFLNGVLPTLARIPSSVERGGYVSRLAERAGIADASVVEELRRQVMARSPRWSLPVEPAEPLKLAERDFVRGLLAAPAEAMRLLGEMEDEDLAGLTTGPILRAMKEAVESGSLAVERVLSRLGSDAERNLLTRIAMEPAPLGPRQSPRDCLNRLRAERWSREMARLKAELARAPEGEIDRISADLLALRRRIETVA